MNILHISPYFPSLGANHAGGLCMGKQIETLRQWNTVYVLSFEASEYDRKLREKLEKDGFCRSIKISRMRRLAHMLAEPWMPNYFAARSSIRFAVIMIYMVRKYKIDAIHAEYASMGQYYWIKKLFPELKFNMTEHDMTAQSYERKVNDSKGIKKVYLKSQLKKVLRKEGKYCRQVDCLFTFNEKDKNLIEKQYGRSDCKVLNPYYGLDDGVGSQEPDDGVRKQGMICFLGQMGRDENYLAAIRLIQIAARVKEQIPELQVYIVGNQPSEQLRQMENDYIHVTGFVDDVDLYLKQAQAAVFPLTLGAGIKLKVLRSLAIGTPVITGSIGAEGIDEEGEVIVKAETDEEYEVCIQQLLRDSGRCRRLSEAGRRYVAERFAWKKSEEILEQVYGRR